LAQGYSQKEGIAYKETFAHVACLEVIRILLAFFVAKSFQVVPNGCEECLPEWCVGRRGLCEAITKV
jgi:hypothetical protein